jgi:hypothetical protein
VKSSFLCIFPAANDRSALENIPPQTQRREIRGEFQEAFSKFVSNLKKVNNCKGYLKAFAYTENT